MSDAQRLQAVPLFIARSSETNEARSARDESRDQTVSGLCASWGTPTIVKTRCQPGSVTATLGTSRERSSEASPRPLLALEEIAPFAVVVGLNLAFGESLVQDSQSLKSCGRPPGPGGGTRPSARDVSSTDQERDDECDRGRDHNEEEQEEQRSKRPRSDAELLDPHLSAGSNDMKRQRQPPNSHVNHNSAFRRPT